MYVFIPETRRDTIIPLVKEVCEKALKQESAMLRLTARLLGRICHGLNGEILKFTKLKPALRIFDYYMFQFMASSYNYNC